MLFPYNVSTKELMKLPENSELTIKVMELAKKESNYIIQHRKEGDNVNLFRNLSKIVGHNYLGERRASWDREIMEAGSRSAGIRIKLYRK